MIVPPRRLAGPLSASRSESLIGTLTESAPECSTATAEDHWICENDTTGVGMLHAPEPRSIASLGRATPVIRPRSTSMRGPSGASKTDSPSRSACSSTRTAVGEVGRIGSFASPLTQPETVLTALTSARPWTIVRFPWQSVDTIVGSGKSSTQSRTW